MIAALGTTVAIIVWLIPKLLSLDFPTGDQIEIISQLIGDATVGSASVAAAFPYCPLHFHSSWSIGYEDAIARLKRVRPSLLKKKQGLKLGPEIISPKDDWPDEWATDQEELARDKCNSMVVPRKGSKRKWKNDDLLEGLDPTTPRVFHPRLAEPDNPHLQSVEKPKACPLNIGT